MASATLYKYYNNIGNDIKIMFQMQTKQNLTRKQVAEFFGVTAGAVKVWEKRGLLKPVSHVNGRPRYKMEEVQTMEKAVK